jgi:cation diffusion facilitator CzcD-associated flavoprotein CzcO
MQVCQQEFDTYCVIGAGASGLTVLKNLREAGIAVEGLEREDDVGGNWNYGRPSSSVYRSAHLISSKLLTEYPDFPMPEDWPEYPSQQQVQEYLRAYTEHFRLHEVIRFNTVVSRVEPVFLPLPKGEGTNMPSWTVTLSTGERRQYRGIIIANGHHWDPNWPKYPGQFDSLVLHSSQYKTPEVLTGKRVLVVGAGNSGCDIAVESAQFADARAAILRWKARSLPMPRFTACAAAIISCQNLSVASRPIVAVNSYCAGMCRCGCVAGWPPARLALRLVHRKNLACQSPIINFSRRIRSSIRK